MLWRARLAYAPYTATPHAARRAFSRPLAGCGRSGVHAPDSDYAPLFYRYSRPHPSDRTDLFTRLKVITASGIAVWLSCTEALVRSAFTGTPQPAVSRRDQFAAVRSAPSSGSTQARPSLRMHWPMLRDHVADSLHRSKHPLQILRFVPIQRYKPASSVAASALQHQPSNRASAHVELPSTELTYVLN